MGTYLRLPLSVAMELAVDAIEFGKSKDDIVALLIYQHMLLKKQERKLLYRVIPTKRAGAPIKRK